MDFINIFTFIRRFFTRLFSLEIAFAKAPHRANQHTLILFPTSQTTLSCGISALVAYKGFSNKINDCDALLADLEKGISSTTASSLSRCSEDQFHADTDYLGGSSALNSILKQARHLKTLSPFYALLSDDDKQKLLSQLISNLKSFIEKESSEIDNKITVLDKKNAETVLERIEVLKDVHWTLSKEIHDNFDRLQQLSVLPLSGLSLQGVGIFKQINTVLNSIDRLEVRGRDSAGISLLFTLTKSEFEDFRKELLLTGLGDQLRARTNHAVLKNNCLTINDSFGKSPQQKGGQVDASGEALLSEDLSTDIHYVSISFVYKYAAEIGSLGDNVAFLRTQIKNDQLLQLLTRFNFQFNSISAHTRWASVGDITQANCHPVDSASTDLAMKPSGIIHVSLNGDIDNYPELKKAYESRFDSLHPDITTDTKIIPLQIERYLKQGHSVNSAFRLAVNDFEGSHAISMHTDLAPGKLFLAQKGSGQAIFTGIAPDHYVTASELYGVVEETQTFIKLNGEANGQILILDQNSPGGVEGMTSMDYAGTPIEIEESHWKHSEITSRDIDRQNYPHYFLKEISEAPVSVSKTLQNRWKRSESSSYYSMTLDDTVLPASIVTDLKSGKIKKIFFIGQGTAGVAAQGCADLFRHYLSGSDFDIRAMKASELSGFSMLGDEASHAMDSFLVVAISQSGTTTDTNRTVDMVRTRGARTLAIVNRRDSDLTFKVDGVLYTSTGRDIEMSVASTKAFYSQITAGALLGLQLGSLTGALSPETLTEELDELMDLPNKMEEILKRAEQIESSARTHSIPTYFWATVGSGCNKTSADEIRIKLSELCYKTISSDYVEDKKHIDLSSEPLIIVCAASTRESVLKDIIKDTAIFHAHKATPIVITNEGETRFDNYAADVFRVPNVKEHFAPILNTLVGHLWGYYAALSMHEGSEFIFQFQEEISDMIDEYRTMGRNEYEIVLENDFREKIASFYQAFSKRRREQKMPAIIGLSTVTNITLLLKYLSGRLPVADFEMDFAKKGTPANMLETFFSTLSDAVNALARPIDAIKHQAKTVTVGTSRIEEKEKALEIPQTFEGVIFNEIAHNNLLLPQITNNNVLVIKNLQRVISHVKGALLYKISGLNLLGEPTVETRIDVVNKTGSLANEASRVETEHRLKGTKNIIVREGNVYIGKGRKDGRSIMIIPVLSPKADSSAIEYLLSINVAFKDPDQVSLLDKIKALGGKYIRIKDTILETDDLQWDDSLLDTIPIGDLFGDSAEKIADTMVNKNTLSGAQ